MADDPNELMRITVMRTAETATHDDIEAVLYVNKECDPSWAPLFAELCEGFRQQFQRAHEKSIAQRN